VIESLVVKALSDLGNRLQFDNHSVLDIARTDESNEIAEKLLADARRAMAEFALDDRDWDGLTGDERRRICERALRYAREAEHDAFLEQQWRPSR
jgi:hypothetical protein